MSRYQVASGSEGELEPGADAGVLRNCLHLKTTKEIDQTEFDLLLQAQRSLDHGFVGPGSVGRRARYLEAAKRGYAGDLVPLAEVFAEALERSERGRKPLAPSKTEEP